jgi:hypothetical protein
MQNHLNLLYREEEREMLPLCEDQGIAVIPWSPLARGRLTRDWNETSERQTTDAFGSGLYAASLDADKRIVDAVAQIAENRGVPRAQVALAWVAQKKEVTAPIIGVSKPHHLNDAIDALSISLTDEEIAALEAPYLPHEIAGFHCILRLEDRRSTYLDCEVLTVGWHSVANTHGGGQALTRPRKHSELDGRFRLVNRLLNVRVTARASVASWPAAVSFGVHTESKRHE